MSTIELTNKQLLEILEAWKEDVDARAGGYGVPPEEDEAFDIIKELINQRKES